MNEIVSKFLSGDKFMTELNLRQPEFTCSACGWFTKYYEKIQKFKETGDLNYIYRNKLDKVCFAHDTAYADSKFLAQRTVLRKAFKD